MTDNCPSEVGWGPYPNAAAGMDGHGGFPRSRGGHEWTASHRGRSTAKRLSLHPPVLGRLHAYGSTSLPWQLHRSEAQRSEMGRPLLAGQGVNAVA
jgi:hypothetical protein